MAATTRLASTLDDIVGKLKEGGFPNEQSISQGVILRILGELNWKIYDPAIVWPEYATGGGRVDFALCHPPRKPRIFIEVKQPGGAEGGVKQALEYAFHTGVPFVVLTDGKTFSFYLPAEQGSYEERCVFMLDLLGRPAVESADILQRYLGRSEVVSDASINVAREEYRSRRRRAAACAEIPSVWRRLVDKGDKSLVDLVANAVESKVRNRPEDADIAHFLASLRQQTPIEVRSPRGGQETSIPKPPSTSVNPKVRLPRGGKLLLLGREIDYKNSINAVAIVLKELARRDSRFLSNFYRHQRNTGSKRKFVAQTVEELYPGRQDLWRAYVLIDDGWKLSTNQSNKRKEVILQIAADVAGLTLGSDIVVNF